MQPPESFDCPSISQYAAEHSIAAILAPPQSIAMLDACVPSGNGAFPWADVVVDADILSQYIAAPAVVVAGEHEHGGPGVVQIRKRREHAEARARNHRAPLEPELKKVAVYNE